MTYAVQIVSILEYKDEYEDNIYLGHPCLFESKKAAMDFVEKQNGFWGWDHEDKDAVRGWFERYETEEGCDVRKLAFVTPVVTEQDVEDEVDYGFNNIHIISISE